MRKLMLAAAILAPLAAHAEEYCHPLQSLEGMHGGDTIHIDCVPDFGMTTPVTRYECRVVTSRFGVGGRDVLASGWDDCQPVTR